MSPKNALTNKGCVLETFLLQTVVHVLFSNTLLLLIKSVRIITKTQNYYSIVKCAIKSQE